MTVCIPDPKLYDNSIALDLYYGLVEEGVSCEERDVGYSILNYGGIQCSNVPALYCMVGESNGYDEAPEVLDFVLNNYEDYQHLIAGALNRPLSWSLDDLDPMTDFDAKIRKRVQDSIQKLEGILGGMEISAEEYESRLAVGLYYLTATPKREWIAENLSLFEERSKELTQIGLSEFKEYLKNNGGMRVDGADSNEFTALEALKKGKGECTEKSKILYAVWRMAGLDPYFVGVDKNGIKVNDSETKKALDRYYEGENHVLVGLYVNGRFRLFDPTLNNSDADHDKFYPMSPRKFLCHDYSNRGEHLRRNGKAKQAISIFSEALEIDSMCVEALNNRGNAWADMPGNEKLAAKDFADAINIDPTFSPAYNNLGVIWLGRRNFFRAEMNFREAIRLSANYERAHNNLASSLASRGKFAEAEKHFKEAIRIKPDYDSPYMNLAAISIMKDDLNDAVNYAAKFLKYISTAGHSEKFNQYLMMASKSKWSDISRKDTVDKFQRDVGLNISLAEVSLISSFAFWQVGDKEPSIKIFSIMIERFHANRASSKSTKDFYSKVLQSMPQTMKEDHRVKKLMSSNSGN